MLHVDAVQGPGRIDCDIATLGADLMSLSAHKLGGPQGAGALISRGDIHIAEPLIRGGGQERGAARRNRERRGHRRLRRRGCVRRKAGGHQAHGSLAGPARGGHQGGHAGGGDFRRKARRGCPIPRCSRFPALKAETAIIAFDLNGIAVSSGSACSSGKVQASHVLAAMGVEPALAQGAVRVSLGWSTTEARYRKFC